MQISYNYSVSARLLMINEEIFSLELKNCYDHLCKSLTSQMMLRHSSYYMGDKDLSYEVNRDIFRLTLRFIHETGRFDWDLL